MAIGGRLTHVGICVSDMERSLRFYRDTLGFAASGAFPELRVENEAADKLLALRGVALHAVYLERDGFRIELLHYARPASPAVAPRRISMPRWRRLSPAVVPSIVRRSSRWAAGGSRSSRATPTDCRSNSCSDRPERRSFRSRSARSSSRRPCGVRGVPEGRPASASPRRCAGGRRAARRRPRGRS